MNWEAIGAIAELLGAVAVIVTLAYLAIQIRQNTRSVTTATYDSVLSAFNDVNTVVVNNPDVASIFIRGNDEPRSLNDAEAVQYAFLMRCWANQWFKLLRLYQQGVLSDAEWSRFGLEAAQAFDTPGGRLFKAENRVFEDLYTALDQFEGTKISEVRLGGSA